MPETFKVFVTTSPAAPDKGNGNASEVELTVLATCGERSVVEHVRLPRDRRDALSRRMLEFRSFVEGGVPDWVEADLEKLGGDLFDLVITGKVRKLYERVDPQPNTLRPVQMFIEDHDLATWPWEYLFDKDEPGFPCRGRRPIVRGIFTVRQGQDPREPRDAPGRPDGKYRVLVVIGVPLDDTQTRPQEEIAWLKGALETLVAGDTVEIKVVRAENVPAIHDKLINNEYDVVHVYAHGAFDVSRGRGYIALRPSAGAAEEPARLYADELGNLLQDRGVKMVFLNACESAVSGGGESDPARSAVAAALLDCGIPVVVATQFSIPVSSANYLSGMIYNSLAAGRSVLSALREGRHAMMYERHRKFFDWGIPVVYTSHPELVLFPSLGGKKSWEANFSDAMASGDDAVTRLAGEATMRGPGLTAAPYAAATGARAETPQPSGREKPARPAASRRVALADLDAKVEFLPDLVRAANAAQSYFEFRVVYLPMPPGTTRMFETGPQIFLNSLAEYLKDKAKELDVDRVLCLTKLMVAGERDGRVFRNYIAGPVKDTSNTSVLSTFQMRQWAREAGVPFAKAVLRAALGQLLVTERRWDIGYHKQTVGCLFDFCNNRSDMVVGFKKMVFDHKPCRDRIDDPRVLEAVDSLLALDLPEPSTSQ